MLLKRERLNRKLERAMEKPLVIVRAGSGFGKTTAVKDCVSIGNKKVVWFACSEFDNVAGRFFQHLRMEIGKHNKALESYMETLGFPSNERDRKNFFQVFARELYKEKNQVVFVFDDCHYINDAEIVEFITELIMLGMENIVWIIISERKKAKTVSVMCEYIEADDLLFTLEETKAYLGMTRPDVDMEVVEQIYEYSAGWPIAIPVIAATYKGNRHILHSGELFEIVDKMLFSKYTEKEQKVLSAISILNSFPRGLVQAVADEEKRDIVSLIFSNLLIIYNAHDQRFYFPSLYLDFLREKRYLLSEKEVTSVLKKAGDWCLGKGLSYDAIEYYSKCHNYEGVWEALLLIPSYRHSKTEGEFMIRQLEALPQDFRNEHLFSEILLSILYLNNLSFDAGRRHLEDVGKKILESADKELLGEWHIAKGLMAMLLNKRGFSNHFRQAANLMKAGSVRWTKHILLVDMGAGITLGDSKAGALKENLEEIIEAVPYMKKSMNGAGDGLDLLSKCEYFYMLGKTREALEYGYHTLYRAEATGTMDILGNALLMIVRCYILIGDYNGLVDTLEHVSRYKREKEAAGLGVWDIIFGYVYSEFDEEEKVAMWIRNAIQHGYSPISLDRPIIIRLRCLISAEAYAEMLAATERYKILADWENSVIMKIYLALGRAISYYALKRRKEAVVEFMTAVELSAENKIVAPFIEWGRKLRSFFLYLTEDMVEERYREFVKETRAKANTFAKKSGVVLKEYKKRHTVENRDNVALSEREIMIVENLSKGLTREEIGELLYLSPNTVKSYLKQIYLKLGAVNSADAVRIALTNHIIS